MLFDCLINKQIYKKNTLLRGYVEMKRGKTWILLFLVRISSVIPLNDLVFNFQFSGQGRLSVLPLFTLERGKRVILNKKKRTETSLLQSSFDYFSISM